LTIWHCILSTELVFFGDFAHWDSPYQLKAACEVGELGLSRFP